MRLCTVTKKQNKESATYMVFFQIAGFYVSFMMGRRWLDVGRWQSCLYLDFIPKWDDMNVLEGTLKPGDKALPPCRKGGSRVSVLPRADLCIPLTSKCCFGG